MMGTVGLGYLRQVFAVGQSQALPRASYFCMMALALQSNMDNLSSKYGKTPKP